MKFKKATYYIMQYRTYPEIGGVLVRHPVEGYIPSEYPNIAIRKRDDLWYIDHIAMGLAVDTTGYRTRAVALDVYIRSHADVVRMVEADRKHYRQTVERLQSLPLEEEVQKWEIMNYHSDHDHRFFKVRDAAVRAGLLVRKADRISYLQGGNIDIIGDPEKLAEIRKLM